MRLAIMYYTILVPPIDTCTRNYIQENVASYFKAHFNLSNADTIVTYGVQYMPGCGLVQKAHNTLAARLLAAAAGTAVSVVH